MLKLMKKLSAVAMTLIAMNQAVAATPPPIEITAPGQQTKKYTVAELKKAGVKTVTGEVYNIQSKKKLPYEGFMLLDVLKHAGWDLSQIHKISMKCADGYTPMVDTKTAGDLDLILAYRERSKNGEWSKIETHDKKWVSPAPYYIIGKTPGSYDKLPWPYQVVGLSEFIEGK